MFWTIVGAILFVMFLPEIISLAVALLMIFSYFIYRTVSFFAPSQNKWTTKTFTLARLSVLYPASKTIGFINLFFGEISYFYSKARSFFGALILFMRKILILGKRGIIFIWFSSLIALLLFFLSVLLFGQRLFNGFLN